MTTKPLKDCLALVTGASRGVGKGIALELGMAGATVIVTGRSRKGKTTEHLPGSIDETAGAITKAGGKGIPLKCDHTKDNDVANLAKHIQKKFGRLDVLVNNVWGGYENYKEELFNLPFWKQPVWRWDKMFNSGVRAHYTASRALSPLLLKSAKPLIVNISFGDRNKFLGDVQYDLAKYTVTRLGFALSEKLKKDSVTAITVFPGFCRTERVLQGASKKALKQTHSPRYVGRAIVHLYQDKNLHKKTGQAFKVADLGKRYGFTDIDGTTPAPFCLPDEE